MHWTSAISDAPSFSEAITQVAEQANDNLAIAGAERADVALVFISRHHAPSYFVAPELLASQLNTGLVVGCSASGVIGAGREIEGRPGVAVCAGVMPGVEAHPFYIKQDELPDADAAPEAWHEVIGVGPEDAGSILLFPDPYTIRPDALISGLDFAYPQAVKSGGLVSGGSGPGTSALFVDNRMRRSGAAGVIFTGGLELASVVSHACRPIGRPMVVTESKENLVLKLDDEKALTALQTAFKAATPDSQKLIRRSVQIGVLNRYAGDPDDAGEYVMRNVLGMVEDSGAIAVGDTIREGQVVQFHVSDASMAEQELRASLGDHMDRDYRIPASALMFSSLSLGKRLHGQPDHDTGIFQEMVAPVPLAGFFSNGEISTAHGHTRLHGYTSSFTMLREKVRQTSC